MSARQNQSINSKPILRVDWKVLECCVQQKFLSTTSIASRDLPNGSNCLQYCQRWLHGRGFSPGALVSSGCWPQCLLLSYQHTCSPRESPDSSPDSSGVDYVQLHTWWFDPIWRVSGFFHLFKEYNFKKSVFISNHNKKPKYLTSCLSTRINASCLHNIRIQFSGSNVFTYQSLEPMILLCDISHVCDK